MEEAKEEVKEEDPEGLGGLFSPRKKEEEVKKVEKLKVKTNALRLSNNMISDWLDFPR